MTLVQVDYAEGDPDTLCAAAHCRLRGDAARMREGFPHPLTRQSASDSEGVGITAEAGILYDALYEKSFSTLLLDLIVRHRRLRGINGDLLASSTHALRHVHT